MNQLERLVADARRELERRRALRPEVDLARAAAGNTRSDFCGALRSPGVSLIAEHKRRSPSAGAIREDLTLEAVVGSYERGGAAAISVLTDPSSFGGCLEDLEAARAVTQLPILRKDFIVDRYQVLEASAAGADAILLIVAALADRELRELHEYATDIGLAALVEVHDARELDRALAVGAELVGINNRDLTTFEVDTGRTFELREQVPAGTLVVAESGFRDRRQVQSLEAAGVDAVLIGEALMRADDPEAAVRTLTAPTM